MSGCGGEERKACLYIEVNPGRAVPAQSPSQLSGLSEITVLNVAIIFQPVTPLWNIEKTLNSNRNTIFVHPYRKMVAVWTSSPEVRCPPILSDSSPVIHHEG